MSSASSSHVRVSVIVPFLNAERFLRETIESVVAQSYDAWELLLVDDGSTDGSTAIARRYAERHPRVFHLEHDGHQNRGTSASRNLGIARASGEYIAFLDADDLCEPQRLEKQVAFLDAHPDVALLGSWYSLIDEDGAHVDQMRLPCEHHDLRWQLFFENQFANSAVMLRRDPVLSTVGLLDESYIYAQDYDFWCRIADRLRVANLPEYLIRYRVHPASLTARYARVETESSRLRRIQIAPLLGWDVSEPVGSEVRLAAMTDLYYGWAESFEPAVLSHAVEEMFRLHALHTAFFEAEGLSPETVHERERELRARIAANLVMLTVFCSSADLVARGRLLARAWHLEPRVFLQPLTLARMARSLAGAYLPGLRLAPAGGHPAPTRRM